MIKVQDASSGKESMFNWEGLRKYSIDWYGKQGIDMQNVSLRKGD
jgi:hypothetical protein